MFALPFSVPGGPVLLVLLLSNRGRSDGADDRVESLERRVEELEADRS